MDELQFTMAIALLNTNVVSCYEILMQMPLVEKWVTTSAKSPPTLLQSDYLKTMTLSHGTCWHQTIPLLRPTVYHQYPKPFTKIPNNFIHCGIVPHPALSQIMCYSTLGNRRDTSLGQTRSSLIHSQEVQQVTDTFHVHKTKVLH